MRANIDNQHSLMDIFKETVKKFPERTALTFQERKYSYQEVDDISEKFALYLSEVLGVTPGMKVGVSSKNSDQLIIYLLAIIKAQAIYLPLDRHQPLMRLQSILSSCNCSLVLSDEPMAFVTNEGNIRIIDFSSLYIQAREVQLKTSFNNRSVTMDDVKILYIIFTSGSTGVPKGVLIGEKGFVNMILFHIKLYEISENDVIPMLSPNSFDVSLFQIFISLLSGGNLIIVEEQSRIDPAASLQIFQREKISILIITGAQLKSYNCANFHSQLRILVTGGEVIDKKTRLFYFNHGVRFFNSYGLTETTCCSSFYEMSGEEDNDSLPIGTPISNMDMAILSEDGEVLPEGEAGEVCVSGVGVLKGYVGEDLNIHPSWVTHKAQTYYRTGDVGILNAQGQFELLGRKDDQIKVNGKRVDIREIELAFIQITGLKDQKVIVTLDSVTNERMIRAVILLDDYSMSIDEIRNNLRGRLPAYMVPIQIESIEAWPITVNGKVDLDQLRYYLDQRRVVGTSVDHDDMTETQRAISNLWRDILGHEVRNIKANFFDEGGDSLKIIKLFDRLNVLFPNSILIADLFDNPDIHDQAKLIDAKAHSSSSDSFEVVEL